MQARAWGSFKKPLDERHAADPATKAFPDLDPNQKKTDFFDV